MILRLIPVLISFLLVAAHFSKLNLNILAVTFLIFPFLLLLKRFWVPRVFQFILIVASLEWIRSMYEYIQDYQANGQSWIRLMFIMLGVALFTALSALVFNNKTIKSKYQ